MTRTLPDASPVTQVLDLLGGKWISQAVSTAAHLGIPEAVAKAPLSSEELSHRLDCHPVMLDRLLSVLVSVGVLARTGEDKFAATELSEALEQGSLHELAMFMGSTSQWQAWSTLPQAVRTGKSAFELCHGQPFYEWLSEHPEEARRYDAGVDVFSQDQAPALVDSYDFREKQCVVDVGGGRARLLVALLTRWPHLKGMLVEQPHLAQLAESTLSEAGLKDRVDIQSADFFQEIPAGGDVYVLKHVLHNWDDERALSILKNCRRAMPAHGQLLVVESILHPGDQQSYARMLDIEMMVMFGQARERSKLEYQQLLRASGFKLQRTTYPAGAFARLLIADVV